LNKKLKKYHINFAKGRYIKSQEYCSASAKAVGFDEIKSYTEKDIDDEFYQRNKSILDQPRGAGYWLWKPYFINKTLNEMNDGDLLVYSDSGSYYQMSVQPLIDLINKNKHGVLSFELLGLLEKDYTKKDTFELMGLDEDKYVNSSQREATYVWLIKNKFTVSLINEYLNYAQDERIITDLASTNKNYDGFKDHRHDQSIWSLLCKKYDIEPHRLISQHGAHLVNDFPNDTYGQITVHHRNPM
jgi:hypothetical protein